MLSQFSIFDSDNWNKNAAKKYEINKSDCFRTNKIWKKEVLVYFVALLVGYLCII